MLKNWSPVGASLVVGSFVMVLFLGCGAAGPVMTTPAVQVAQANAAAPERGAGEAAAPPVTRKIVYTSQIDVVVESMAAAQERLTKLIESVREQGGYLSRQEIIGSVGSHRRGSWTVRVPLAQFDGFVAEVEKLGELERNLRDSQDVTEAYADLEARLKNKQASETRLLSHLEKSAALKDTLELERELSRVRGEIEQVQGQLNVLKNKSDLATVTLTLIERQGYTPPLKPTFVTRVSRTFDHSWQSLVACGQTLALFGVALGPWLAVGVVVVTPTWLLLRRRRVRK